MNGSCKPAWPAYVAHVRLVTHDCPVTIHLAMISATDIRCSVSANAVANWLAII